MKLGDVLTIIGGIGLIIIALAIILIPTIATIIIGIHFANQLHLTGITWWAFLILFYLLIAGILGMINKIARG